MMAQIINYIGLLFQGGLWVGLLGFIYWVYQRNEKAKHLEMENNYLRVMKDVNETKEKLDHASLDELVRIDNERSSGGDQKG